MVFTEHPEFSFNALIQWHPDSSSNTTMAVMDASSIAPGHLVGSGSSNGTNSAVVRLTCGSVGGDYYYEITGDQRVQRLQDTALVADVDGWVRFVDLESAVLCQTIWSLGVDPKAFKKGSQVDIVLKDGRGRTVKGVKEGDKVHLNLNRGEPVKLSLLLDMDHKGGSFFDNIKLAP
ncbi:hypothetical protein LZ023_34460 [Pseudomonas silvicola]|nr:hypothetical protein LZ023_34460 [Pseudomonas silvicola]